MDLDIVSVMDPSVPERLHHREVGVTEKHVLADNRDIHRLRCRMHTVHERRPLRKIGGGDDLQVVRQEAVQSLLVQHERDLVDGWDVGGTDHATDRYVAEQRDLLLQVAADRTIGTADDGVRLQAERSKLLDRVLRRLRLQLTRRSDEGHQGHVHEGTVFAPHLVAQLPDGFQEGERFDVSYGAADLDDLEVGLFRFGERADPRFDLVGDVGDHLNGLPEVVAAPLLREHR